MLNKKNTTIERIIAKIDNDFNPDNSDWIPRVGAWTIDVLSTLKVLRTETKRRKLLVTNNIAYSQCDLDIDDIKIYDNRECPISKATDFCNRINTSSTGDGTEIENLELSNTMSSTLNVDPAIVPDISITEQSNEPGISPRYNIIHNYYSDCNDKNYVIIDNNKIELNFDTDYIYVESKEVVTYCSEVYGCDLPVIPNNGYLIELITSWCMYKMLCRGYKHIMLNLSSNSPAINPYIMYMELKDKAKTSLILDAQGNVMEDNGAWRNAFYDYTFNSRG